MRLLGPALLAWAAAAITLPWPTPWRAASAAACLLLALGLGVRASRRPRNGAHGRPALPTLALVLAAVGLVLAASAAHGVVRETGPVPALAERGAHVRAEGVVVQEPRAIGPGLDGGGRVVLRLRLEAVTARGVRAEVASPVLVVGPAEVWSGLTWQERVRVRGRVSPTEPGDDVVAVLHPTAAPESVAGTGPVLDAVEHARTRLRRSVDPLPADPRGLLPALVIGDTALTPPDLTDAMLATGMSHLSAVSGSNVTLVVGGVLLVCSWCGVRYRARVPVALLALGGFVLLCRPEPSVLRAGVMGAVGLLAVLAARRGAALPALAAAVLLLLALDPWLARAPGFALSTLATLGLVLLARPWGEALGRHLPARLRPLGFALAIPMAAQLVCGPVLVVLQEAVTPVAVLTNLLAAPLVAPSTVLGVAATLGGLVHPGLGTPFAWLGAVPTAGIAAIARWGVGAPIPLATISWPGGLPGALMLATLCLAALLTGPWVLAHAGRRPVLALVLVVTGLVLLLPGARADWLPATWAVAACDVGQGDAVVVASGPQRAVLVDTGPDPPPLLACLDDLGVSTLDAVVLTHDHQDHAGGLAAVLAAHDVGEVVVPAAREGTPLVSTATVATVEASGVPLRAVRAGADLGWGSVHARVLNPSGRLGEGGGEEALNDASLVLLAQLSPEGGADPATTTTVLLTGDIEPPAQRAVLRALAVGPGPLGVDVLKVAHHGSGNQDPRFVEQVRARVALVSVGVDNRHGHPDADLVRSLQGHGTVVLRTDLHGTLAVGGSGPGLWYAHEEQ